MQDERILGTLHAHLLKKQLAQRDVISKQSKSREEERVKLETCNMESLQPKPHQTEAAMLTVGEITFETTSATERRDALAKRRAEV